MPFATITLETVVIVVGVLLQVGVGGGCRTEVTFDFMRLGVLVIRGSMEGGVPVAHKVATATLSEAHIQATIGKANTTICINSYAD